MFDALHDFGGQWFCRVPVACRLHRGTGPAGRGTYDHFQAFKQQPLHRAYALARAVNGSYTAVFVGNQASAETAETAAMARCRAYASEKLYADPSSCRIYAIDDTIVGTRGKIAPASGGS